MYHPTTRVLTVLEMLQSRPGISGREIADRLEVSRRTVRRYITMLQDLGIPVEAERGPAGGYRLRPGFRMPPLMFTPDEALATALGLLALERLGLIIENTGVESARAKLRQVMPLPLQGRIRAIEEVVALRVPTAEVMMQAGALSDLAEASYQGRRVWLRYRAWRQNDTERQFDPYSLLYLQTRWYAVGYCHLRRDLRMFRVDRILDLKVLDERFQRPEEFDPVAFAQQSLATMPGAWQIAVLLDLPLWAARERVPPARATLEAAGGGTLLRCTSDDLPSIARFLVGIDCEFTVIGPDELRDALRDLAGEIAALAGRDHQRTICIEKRTERTG